MTYSGYIRNGVAVFEPPVSVADGTPVHIDVVDDNTDFWRGKSVEQLATEQGVVSQSSFVMPALEWSDADNVDDFLALVRQVRR